MNLNVARLIEQANDLQSVVGGMFIGEEHCDLRFRIFLQGLENADYRNLAVLTIEEKYRYLYNAFAAHLASSLRKPDRH